MKTLPILIGLIIISIMAFVAYYIIDQPVGMPNAEAIDTWPDPYQTAVEEEAYPIRVRLNKGQLFYNQLAAYDISAKILSKKKYFRNWDGKIAPYDLALGWGALVDPKLKKFIHYNQWDRFYFYKYKSGSPYNNDYISKHSSNCHIIPANNNLRRALKYLKKEQLIRLKGYLVNVDGSYKGYPVEWHSSTSRNDTGDGACEIIYVTKIYTKEKVYQ